MPSSCPGVKGFPEFPGAEKGGFLRTLHTKGSRFSQATTTDNIFRSQKLKGQKRAGDVTSHCPPPFLSLHSNLLAELAQWERVPWAAHPLLSLPLQTAPAPFHPHITGTQEASAVFPVTVSAHGCHGCCCSTCSAQQPVL